MIEAFTVIIPSAGNGERFGSDIPKQYLKIGRTLIINYSLELFLNFKECKKIIIAVSNLNAIPKDLTKDIVQIGVNEEIAEKLQNMMDDLDPQWFSTMQDIYKFAVAVAIAKGLKPDMKAKNLKAKTWRWADTAKDSSGTGDRLDDKKNSKSENSGFSGRISKLQYFAKNLNNEEIKKIYENGPYID